MLSSKKGSLSQTCKKNSEANTKVYGLNQRTMQALNNLALVYATFQQAGANLEVGFSEGDLLFADVRPAMEGLAEAQQHQERLQGELKCSRESLDTALMDMKESKKHHEHLPIES